MQFGLNLHQFPETSVSSNLFLHAFISPPKIIVERGGPWIESQLLANPRHGFVDDGYRNTDYDIPGLPNFRFKPKSMYSPKTEPARQLIHASGEFFIRILQESDRDSSSKVAFFYINNRDSSQSSVAHHFELFCGMIKDYEARWLAMQEEARKEELAKEEEWGKRVVEAQKTA